MIFCLYRLDDPLLMERYRMLGHPLSASMSAAAAAAAYPPHPHAGSLFAAPPYLTPPGMRYPSDLLAQQLAYLPPGTKLPEHMSPTAAAAAMDRSVLISLLIHC